MTRPTYRESCGEKGRKGGKASGARKRRTAEHYARLSRLGVEARKRKLEGRE